MAYVGTITFHDADSETLASRCYTAAAHESPTERIVAPLVADLRRALQQERTLAVGVLQDGAPELWNLLRPAVLAEPQVTTYYEAIDRYHLNDHLVDVLRALEPDAAARAARLSHTGPHPPRTYCARSLKLAAKLSLNASLVICLISRCKVLLDLFFVARAEIASLRNQT
jgi:hypothetical protein